MPVLGGQDAAKRNTDEWVHVTAPWVLAPQSTRERKRLAEAGWPLSLPMWDAPAPVRPQLSALTLVSVTVGGGHQCGCPRQAASREHLKPYV